VSRHRAGRHRKSRLPSRGTVSAASGAAGVALVVAMVSGAVHLPTPPRPGDAHDAPPKGGGHPAGHPRDRAGGVRSGRERQPSAGDGGGWSLTRRHHDVRRDGRDGCAADRIADGTGCSAACRSGRAAPRNVAAAVVEPRADARRSPADASRTAAHGVRPEAHRDTEPADPEPAHTEPANTEPAAPEPPHAARCPAPGAADAALNPAPLATGDLAPALRSACSPGRPRRRPR
jgi:hypothetical protein